MARTNQQWTDADANNDGKLDLAEWKVFLQVTRKVEEDAGGWNEADDHADDTYAAMN